MKYKVGDKVRVKSIDWYEENKDDSGSIKIGSKEYYFVEEMLNYCGAPLTIKEVDSLHRQPCRLAKFSYHNLKQVIHFVFFKKLRR